MFYLRNIALAAACNIDNLLHHVPQQLIVTTHKTTKNNQTKSFVFSYDGCNTSPLFAASALILNVWAISWVSIPGGHNMLRHADGTNRLQSTWSNNTDVLGHCDDSISLANARFQPYIYSNILLLCFCNAWWVLRNITVRGCETEFKYHSDWL